MHLSTSSSGPPGTISIEDWSFLVVYRSMITRAIDAEEGLLTEAASHFEMNTFPPHSSEFNDGGTPFKVFLDNLSDYIHQKATQLSPCSEGEDRYSILPALFTHIFLEPVYHPYDLMESDSRINICDRILESHNTAARFIALQHHLDHSLDRPPTPEERRVLWDANERVCTQAKEVLSSAGLLKFMPSIARDHPSYMSSFILTRMDKGVHDARELKWYDCMGRNILLRFAGYSDEETLLKLLPDFEELIRSSHDSHHETLAQLLNQTDSLGRTILHVACQRGMPSFAKKLLDYGACPDITTIFGSSPLHYACASKSNRADICIILLARGLTDPHKKDDWGHTPIHYADKNGQVDKMMSILRTGRACTPEDGYETLIDAVKTGNRSVVGRLLAAGATPLYGSPVSRSLLLDAIDFKQVSSLQALCEAYPNVLFKGSNWMPENPLTHAVSRQYYDGVEYLLKQDNVDVNGKDYLGRYALEIAVAHANRQILRLLLEHPKIDLYIRSESGKGILEIAKDYRIRGMIVDARKELFNPTGMGADTMRS
ncbi:unnamed protein product [Periconia digitata]|uniref:Ankyrin n=1 Tax=Periconia digitata TaxID=1303443 RepID=A0A9W4UBS9_9PLEO|nr:unnamed protein product [Periconia digitata]